ncbi:MAG: hypothetical protein GX107_04905 [Clostridiales bacterium]|jgi:hypothetical protein|nr:hypothetical protein [Clostridiales bacterium]
MADYTTKTYQMKREILTFSENVSKLQITSRETHKNSASDDLQDFKDPKAAFYQAYQA